MMFDTAGATPSDDLVRDFVTQVQQYQSPIAETIEVQVEQPLESAAPTQARRMRMNTKFRTQTTYVSLSLSLSLSHSSLYLVCLLSLLSLSEVAQVEEVSDTFWERNFESSDAVPWFRFQQAFISDYDTQLKSKWKSVTC